MEIFNHEKNGAWKPPDDQQEPSGSSSAKKLLEDVQQVGRSPTRAQATSLGEEEDARAETLREIDACHVYKGSEQIFGL